MIRKDFKQYSDELVLCYKNMLNIGQHLYDSNITEKGCRRILGDIDNMVFLPRYVCEYALNVPQIIPYVVITYNDKILVYTRDNGGAESRLHGLKSVGFGGHINPIDMPSSLKSHEFNEEHFEKLLKKAIQRELMEEVALNNDNYTLRCNLDNLNYWIIVPWIKDFIGRNNLNLFKQVVINNDFYTINVENFHIGIIAFAEIKDIDKFNATANQGELNTKLEWLSIEDIADKLYSIDESMQYNFENWSKVTLVRLLEGTIKIGDK